jgi:hypothetical protein
MQQLGASSVLQPPSLEESLITKLLLVEKELSWHSHQPFTSFSTPLVFVHEPQHNGAFNYPSELGVDEPNTGVHAMVERHQVNAVFLSSEQRLYQILAYLKDIQLCHAEPTNPSSISDLLDQTYTLLMDMQREKEYQWQQQRGCIQIGVDGVFVNTGAICLL